MGKFFFLFFFVFNLNRKVVLIVTNRVYDSIKMHQTEHWVVMTIIFHSKTIQDWDNGIGAAKNLAGKSLM